MELTELVSPHVAMPVIGVVVCAIMVFAFGFRSPVQPPSFNFEEEKRSKRRTKQTKLKGPVNGHLLNNDPATEDVPKPTPKPVKVAKTAPSPKTKTNESKLATKKEIKQDPKIEKKGKPKKDNVKEESVKKVKSAPLKKDADDDGEWTTIQVSKKSKKQKASNKKDGGRADATVEPENEVDIVLSSVNDAAAASPALVSEVEEPSTPQAGKAKSKKKKEKVAGKNKLEDKEEPVTPVPVTEKPVSETTAAIQGGEPGEGKKKKTKKEKKASGAAAAAASETLPQDVAPTATAAGKPVKKDAAPAGKSAKKEVVPAAGKPSKKESSPTSPTPPASPFSLVTLPLEVSKPSPPKKKGKGKESTAEEKVVEKAADIQLVLEEKPVAELSKKAADKKITNTKVADPRVEPEPILSEPEKSASAPAVQSPPSITFDEIGDSWQEAAPKSKKKKPRRDN